MGHLHRIGGTAALVAAGSYVLAFAIFLQLVETPNPVEFADRVRLLILNRSALYAGTMIAYVLGGFALIALVAALHQRFDRELPSLMPIASPIGFIWAGLILASGMIFLVGSEAAITLYRSDPELARSLWRVVAVVQNGLGGGVEIVGGVWVLLVSFAGRQSNGLPLWLVCFGILVGAIGVLTVVPGFDVAVDAFGLSMILWFASLGVIMLRNERGVLAQLQV